MTNYSNPHNCLEDCFTYPLVLSVKIGAIAVTDSNWPQTSSFTGMSSLPSLVLLMLNPEVFALLFS